MVHRSHQDLVRTKHLLLKHIPLQGILLKHTLLRDLTLRPHLINLVIALINLLHMACQRHRLFLQEKSTIKRSHITQDHPIMLDNPTTPRRQLQDQLECRHRTL